LSATRRFVLSALGAAGALVVGWGVLPPRTRLGSRHMLPVKDGEVGLNGWIKIADDHTVVLAMHRSEMGQGVHTALPMLVAEELGVPLDRVRLVPAGPQALYGNVAVLVGTLPLHPSTREPGRETATAQASAWFVSKLARELGINVTGGSTSVADAWHPLRLAAATARSQLMGAAALRWKLAVDELTLADGVISHSSGPSARFGELAREAAQLPPGDVRLKSPDHWALIGRSMPRTDVVAKSNGSARFGLDVREPGQLFAAVRMAPQLGGSPGAITNETEVLARPGVLRMVRLSAGAGAPPGVAIIARSTWHAMRAVQALAIRWHAPPHDPQAGLLDSAAILQGLEQQALQAQQNDGGFVFHATGDVVATEQQARGRPDDLRVVEAVYRTPYLAHAAMEPMNCTAQWRDGRLTLWVPTQTPGMARAAAARVLGIDEAAVSVHVTLLGGGFGRRLEQDFVVQAAQVAHVAAGAPVQLVWPREEDMKHDFYRPAAAAALRAVVDAQGLVRSLRITSAGDAVTPRWLERGLPALAGPVDAPDKTGSEGLFDLPYRVEHQRVAHVATRSGVPVGMWRSVGHSSNAFFSECFIDELAHAARQDPVAFRLDLLRGMPRHAAVLKLAAEKARWGGPLPAGRARGVALHESFGTVVAQVVEASAEAGQLRVHRVVCALDCGVAVNPGIIAQQMEGAIVFGLTAALHGRIDIVKGEVQQRNFPGYPLLALAHTPVIETYIVPSTRAPSGVGEPGTPPVAPALANALFALTGQRVRELPLVVKA
jgi:isoquinoline 1-oxidoreductase beta subunit